MKTLVACTYFSFPEPEKIALTCASTLRFMEACENHRTFFVARTPERMQSFAVGKTTVELVKGVSRWFWPKGFHQKVVALKPDYVLVQGFGYAPYLVLLRRILPGARILLQCNGFAPPPKGFKRWIYRFANPYIDGYLFTGKDNARPWIQLGIFAESKVFELMEGATDFELTRKERDAASFVWVGRLNPGKDPLTVLHAFSDFLRERPDATLTLVGTGEMEADIRKRIREKGISNAVELLGKVEYGQMQDLYNRHRYFISASHYEGSGFALLEAMACGCVPVIADIPPFRYMAGQAGRFFDPGNASELLDRLRGLRDDRWPAESVAVRSQYNEKLSPRALAKGLITVFQSLR